MWVPQGFAYLPKAWRLPLPLAGTPLPLRKGKSCPPLLGITAQLCGCTRLTHDRNVRNSFCFWSNTCKIWVSLKVTWKWESFWSLWNPFLNQTLDLKCQVTWELLMNDKCVFFFFSQILWPNFIFSLRMCSSCLAALALSVTSHSVFRQFGLYDSKIFFSSCWMCKPGFSQRNALLRQASSPSAQAVTMPGPALQHNYQ